VSAQRSERWLAAVGVVAGVALFVSLFLPWYEVVHSSVSRKDGGFSLVFGSGPADGWNVVAPTSYALAMGAVLIVVLLVIRLLTGRRAAAVAGLAFAVLSLAIAGYRVLNPPTHRVAVGTAGRFSRVNSVSASHSFESQPWPADSGGPSALAAALLATITIGALVIASRQDERSRVTET
jgi:hypothetical protein